MMQRQVDTAANYGVQSRFWDYMSGSTNVQVGR
jgi:sterol desaturase/sphingolipid hydroxylase (fatty acid hydroxylase superfamily)